MRFCFIFQMQTFYIIKHIYTCSQYTRYALFSSSVRIDGNVLRNISIFAPSGIHLFSSNAHAHTHTTTIILSLSLNEWIEWNIHRVRLAAQSFLNLICIYLHKAIAQFHIRELMRFCDCMCSLLILLDDGGSICYVLYVATIEGTFSNSLFLSFIHSFIHSYKHTHDGQWKMFRKKRKYNKYWSYDPHMYPIWMERYYRINHATPYNVQSQTHLKCIKNK